nr:hypothetical protein [Tanacetum cinerariifolium]
MELERKLDEVDRVVNKLKFDLIKDLLLNSKITSVDTLQRVAMLIHDNAIAEPSLYNVYAQLCSDLNNRLPSFQSDDKVIKFRGLIINKCQETFQGSDKLLEDSDLERLTRRRTIGNACFIGELFKQNLLAVRIVHDVIKTLLSPDSKLCLEVRVEAVCQLLNIVDKKLDDTSYYGRFNDVHFNVLTKELSVDQSIPTCAVYGS